MSVEDMFDDASFDTAFPATFYVLTIVHAAGTEVYYFRDRAVALDQLFLYVEEEWDTEYPGTTMPSDPDLAIKAYFQGNEHQSYTLNKEELLEEVVL